MCDLWEVLAERLLSQGPAISYLVFSKLPSCSRLWPNHCCIVRARARVCVCVCVCVYTLKNTSLSALVYQHNHRANPHLHTSLSLDSSTPSMPSSITCHHQICVRLVPGQPSFPSLFPLSEEIGDSYAFILPYKY